MGRNSHAPARSSWTERPLRPPSAQSMSLPLSSYDESAGWGAPVETEDVVTQAIKKEKILQEIATQQEDLRAMLARVKDVQKDVDKLASGNETLQMYIDNLTLQMAKRR